ncbi:MAG TPA: dihydroneopterin triphosphate diphosphatase [Rhodocyclaceae bacterium]|nr:dihydroneopterin triphosphate diphosphatase [Rhodocyclaceae bacterium]
MPGAKKPVSVLVLIHTPQLEILLLERATRPGFWQSVTGSVEDELDQGDLRRTAHREVREETGIAARPEALIDWRLSNRFEIFREWRYRYPEGVSHNVEHVYSLCVARETGVVIAPDEHLAHLWLPWRAAADRVFSWSNRDAILMLPLLQDELSCG